ncbi:hypothetical protein QQX98_000733 [Neonectria punicea]|uniref:Uncharacterized protein n=1 Tax=Neonectria punicea TaxID=979145 RepID=A0ABR1HSD0_9HYPO
MEATHLEEAQVSQPRHQEPIPPADNPADNPAERTLQLVNGKVPYQESAASWVLPDVHLLGEDRFCDFDMKSISHVVLQISGGRQEQVFAQVGVKYEWNLPFPFWHFLGKMLSKALFADDSLLDILNFVPVNNYEFVGYVNKDRVVDNDQKDKDKVNVIDVHLKRPQPGQPIQIFWKPARGLVVRKIEEWVKEQEPNRQ